VSKSSRVRWAGRAAHMREMRNLNKILKGRDHSEDLGVDEKIILELILVN